MMGQHKFAYRRPRTGEKRRIRQHLRIDRLGPEVREGIVKARAEGRTWEEAAEIASALAGEHVGTMAVHRWFDLRVAQPAKEAEQEATICAALAGKIEPGLIREALELFARGRPELFSRLLASAQPPEARR